MIRRTLSSHLLELSGRYPAVTVTGPRQSGKTTLCRAVFSQKPYVSLENPKDREYATDDAIGFLGRYPDGAILDEIQAAPQLLSYLQGLIDEEPDVVGRWILSGSQNLGLLDAVTQSLAGRTALLELLPLSYEEVLRFEEAPRELFEALFKGGYPRIYQQRLPADEWLEAYLATYVERDLRQLLEVGNLVAFRTFMRLVAGRSGQLINLSSLAADGGISVPTARSWLSVLEASYLVHRLPPWVGRNPTKRLVKTPKLYLWDSGLMCRLLGLEHPGQIESHPLRGQIFETWVVSEIAKLYYHHGKRPRLSFYAQRGRFEVDLLIEGGLELTAVEIKSSKTPSGAFLNVFSKLEAHLEGAHQKLGPRLVVYGGGERQERERGWLMPWSELGRVVGPGATEELQRRQEDSG